MKITTTTKKIQIEEREEKKEKKKVSKAGKDLIIYGKQGGVMNTVRMEKLAGAKL